MKIIKHALYATACILLVSCASSGRYSEKHDSAPVRPPTNIELQDAVVKHEPIGRGNNPYTVWGKSYTPMTERKAYTKVGTASWYGRKFHGHLTSNGEVYDMYAMSAAHKTLPLPSYVKVTNLANNKSVVVRVNDRGPFHGDRIIDLSYSAAYKIGVFDTGTARVKIETILPNAENKRFEVQIAGFKSKNEAEDSAKGLGFMLNKEGRHKADNSGSKIVYGPFKDKQEAESLVQKIKQIGFEQVRISETE